MNSLRERFCQVLMHVTTNNRVRASAAPHLATNNTPCICTIEHVGLLVAIQGTDEQLHCFAYQVFIAQL